MTPGKLHFVAFQPHEGGFVALLSVEGLVELQENPQHALARAARLYERSVRAMRCMIDDIQGLRSQHRLLPARIVWRLGDRVFRLRDDLAGLSMQIDGVYGHLARDLQVKRKWLEKVVTLRRYLPREDLIPPELNWGSCEKGTGRAAQRLAKGRALARDQ